MYEEIKTIESIQVVIAKMNQTFKEVLKENKVRVKKLPPNQQEQAEKFFTDQEEHMLNYFFEVSQTLDSFKETLGQIYNNELCSLDNKNAMSSEALMSHLGSFINNLVQIINARIIIIQNYPLENAFLKLANRLQKVVLEVEKTIIYLKSLENKKPPT